MYAEKRRAFCPNDPKPFCSYCDTHCYRPDMREHMRDVMRYAGPRSMWHGHAIEGVKHLIEGKKHKVRQSERPPSRQTRQTGAATEPRRTPMRTTVTTQIVKIDEELCNGCGLCVAPCAEGAIQIIDGKAKVISEELCDGAGFCLGVCPTGALTIEEREAVPFDHEAAEAHMAEKLKTYIAAGVLQVRDRRGRCSAAARAHQGRSTWVCTRCLPALIHG